MIRISTALSKGAGASIVNESGILFSFLEPVSTCATQLIRGGGKERVL